MSNAQFGQEEVKIGELVNKKLFGNGTTKGLLSDKTGKEAKEVIEHLSKKELNSTALVTVALHRPDVLDAWLGSSQVKQSTLDAAFAMYAGYHVERLPEESVKVYQKFFKAGAANPYTIQNGAENVPGIKMIPNLFAEGKFAASVPANLEDAVSFADKVASSLKSRHFMRTITREERDM